MKELVCCVILLGMVMTFGSLTREGGKEASPAAAAAMNLGERTRSLKAKGRLPAWESVEGELGRVEIAEVPGPGHP